MEIDSLGQSFYGLSDFGELGTEFVDALITRLDILIAKYL